MVKNELYKNSLDQLSAKEILPGVMDVLEKLKEKGIKIAIGSSSKNAKKILEKIELIDYFDAISDGTDISKSKPDPEVFLIAADKLKIKKEYCAVVEDAHSGIEAAKSANMMAFATGDAKNSQIKDANFEDLLTYIK